ncbi:MAG: twin-arginine translocase TatA/TatE family subunit [Phycisphaerales bacterium]|nr:twin-arginine translocase TatA/TatE family subunit [Phycisphaerales bacterium]
MIGGTILAWGLDPMHLLFFGFIALLLFGRRLPDVGRSLGRGIMEFKRGLRDVSNEMDRADEEDQKPRQNLKPPADTWAVGDDRGSRDRNADREPQAASSGKPDENR